MNYQLLSKTEPVARKEYACIWCPEKIIMGEKHIHEASTFDGFQNHRWHLECWAASQNYFTNSDETDFEPHACKRGTSSSR